MTENETYEGVEPSKVHVGDRLQFMTRETGFNGVGLYSRTGMVTKVTAKAVKVDCGQGWGTAVLRKDLSAWVSRDVRRVVTEEPALRPYNAENVQIVDQGLSVTALYIPDLEQAKDPKYVMEHITDRRYEAVEVVGEATRHFKHEGAVFSGWIVRSGSYYSEPISNKREALRQLRREITGYFNR
ncbi:hypothetical protein [Streptomyces sp. NPDC059928]|uniref:hypothetical protein n=1 Tax=unclassified Streptomyces TaxID=2593676 RepID=UPI003669F440